MKNVLGQERERERQEREKRRLAREERMDVDGETQPKEEIVEEELPSCECFCHFLGIKSVGLEMRV